MRELSPVSAPTIQLFRPSRLWRIGNGALGLIACVLAVRFVAQHPNILAIVLGVPIVCLGALVTSRAPRAQVRFSATELHIVALFSTRRIARNRITSAENSGGRGVVRWTTRRGRARVTRLPGVGTRGRGAQFLQALSDWASS